MLWWGWVGAPISQWKLRLNFGPCGEMASRKVDEGPVRRSGQDTDKAVRRGGKTLTRQ